MIYALVTLVSQCVSFSVEFTKKSLPGKPTKSGRVFQLHGVLRWIKIYIDISPTIYIYTHIHIHIHIHIYIYIYSVRRVNPHNVFVDGCFCLFVYVFWGHLLFKGIPLDLVCFFRFLRVYP